MPRRFVPWVILVITIVVAGTFLIWTPAPTSLEGTALGVDDSTATQPQNPPPPKATELPPAPPPPSTSAPKPSIQTDPAPAKKPLAENARKTPPPQVAKDSKQKTPQFPDKVLKVLAYVDKYDKAMEGYEGGRNFGNFEKLLPQFDDKQRRIRYREWDVNPRRPGVNRGAERLVTGSDQHAYYTSDHYKSFRKIR